MHHELKVHGFTMDAIANMPVVLLKDADGQNTVPIWISPQEAVSIVAELIGRDSSDEGGRRSLMDALFVRLGLKVVSIAVDDVKDGLWEASIRFLRDDEEIRVDVRAVDALIISLRHDMPLLVADEVLAKASLLAMNGSVSGREANARRFVDFLENLNPEDMGKYPM